MFFAFEWTVIAVMIVLNGILSAYEMALASVSHSRLLVLSQQKKHGAAAALYMKDRLEASFAALQLGITLFGAIAAATGGAFVDEHLAPRLMLRWGLSHLSAKVAAMTLFVLPLSVVTILFAELLPKLFALRNREWVCLWLSPVMKRLATLMSPIVGGLEWIVKGMLAFGQKYFRGLTLQTESASLNELRAAVALARTSRVIGAREEKIVLAAAQLATRPIKQVILPAADISMIPIDATLTEALLQAHLDLHTRFPICTIPNDPQTINGYITFKDLVVALKMKPSTPTVEGIIRPIKKIPEDSFISQVLEQMMREKIHIALVVDKAGSVLGMITLEDIVEEMLGDIEDEFDHLPTHFHPAGPGWIMGGGVSMTTVYQCLGLPLETAPPAIRSLRLAEWSAQVLGRAVARGDLLQAEGIEVSVRKLRRRKVAEAFLSLVSLVLLLFVMAMPARATVEDEAAQTVDHFYNLDFDAARADAAHLEMAHPGHPAGAFYTGVALFQQYLLEYPPQEKTLSRFEQAMQRTLTLAKNMEDSQPAISHYYQGAALGFLARVAVARHHYATAISKARQGRIQLEKALELDPHLEDAYMGLGMYDYFADRMPTAVKPFAYLMMGLWGNREKGLANLERTMHQGHAARMEATSILAAIYASQAEQNWGKAQPLFAELTRRYPENPRYRLGLSYVLQRQGHWEDALAVLDRDGAWLTTLHPLVRPTAEASVRLRAVEDLLFLGRYAEADRELKRLEAGPLVPFLADWLRLRRANWLDAMQRHPEAQALYQEIKLKKPTALAQQFQNRPFPEGSHDVLPNLWPLPVVPE